MGVTPSSNSQLLSIRSVLAWGAVNLALLTIGAAGLPLWAHHPFPRESLAFYELICGQTLLVSMLFPLLAQTRWTLAINLAILLPMDELGGLLSTLDQAGILRCWFCVGIWVAGLGVCSRLLDLERRKLAVVALASCMTAGGAVVDYLRWEAAAINSQSNSFAPVSLLPCLCDLVLHFNPKPWIWAAIPAIGAMIGFFIKRIAIRRSTSLHNAA
jgi:hypothetical protein